MAQRGFDQQAFEEALAQLDLRKLGAAAAVLPLVLILLIGISESIAEGIIDFRDANGGFDSVEDLMEVECISESSYQRIRLKVTV
jgi:competence ComEA-like helix-hairpin-helix protein